MRLSSHNHISASLQGAQTSCHKTSVSHLTFDLTQSFFSQDHSLQLFEQQLMPTYRHRYREEW